MGGGGGECEECWEEPLVLSGAESWEESLVPSETCPGLET